MVVTGPLHREYVGRQAHAVGYLQATDPTLDAGADVRPGQVWTQDVGSIWPQYIRNPGNTGWVLQGFVQGPISIAYTFSTTTTDADPGGGFLRLDNATQLSATTIRADLLDTAGVDWSTVLDTFDDSTSTIKGHLRLVKAADQTKWILFTASAVATPSGYRNIAVAVVAGSGANPFSNADTLILSFQRTGDKGTTGSAGTNGTNPQVEDEGTPLAARTYLNFVGAGVTATDNPGNDSSDITIPGGSGLDPYASDPGGPFAKLVDPTAGGLSAWVNQTSQSVTATITSAVKREIISAPIHSTQNELRIRKKALAASSNYTATFLLDFRALTNDSHIGGGICLRDGGGLLAVMRTDFGNNSLYIEHWASASGFSAATVDTFGYNQTGLVWMRIIDDGTNRDWLIGDGTNFTRLTRESRTAYLTPTEIGFFANGYSTYLTIAAAQVGLLSFLEA